MFHGGCSGAGNVDTVKVETHWRAGAHAARGSFKYGTVFTLTNTTSLSHSVTDAAAGSLSKNSQDVEIKVFENESGPLTH